MTGLCVLGGILVFLILLGFLRIGAVAEYSGEGYWVKVKIGPLLFQILPKREKPEKQEKPQKAKKQEKKKKEKPKQAEHHQEKAKKKKGGNLPMFKELLGLVLDAQKGLRKKLVIRELTLHLTLGGGGEDPAKSAILYGQAWAAIGNLWTVLERVFIIKNPDVQANIDFLTPENTVYARAALDITLGGALKLGVRYGLQALGILLRQRRRNRKMMKEGT